MLAQGGFYEAGSRPLGLAVAASLVLALLSLRAVRLGVVLVPLAVSAALAGWAITRGAVSDEPDSGVGPALLIAGFAGVLLVAHILDHSSRQTLLDGLLGAGAVVALCGWAGVVWHVSPLALSNDGVWRATSTLTYANATAAVLVPLLLVSLALRTNRPHRLPMTCASTVLAIGAVATLSRAGAVSLLVGLVVLARVAGLRPAATACLAPALGSMIAVAGLVPSMPIAAREGRPLAVGAMAVGILAAGLVDALRVRTSLTVRRRWAFAGFGSAVLCAGLPVLVDPIQRPLAELARWRGALSSPTREATAEAAIRLAAQHPLVGVGPGHGWVRWSDAGHHQLMRYVHNEYLQALVEFGGIGLALLLALLGGCALALRDARRKHADPALIAGAAAALAAFSVHGAFDFVWHVPAVPLVVAALLGLATAAPMRTSRDRLSRDLSRRALR
jgi:hypothetical protein